MQWTGDRMLSDDALLKGGAHKSIVERAMCGCSTAEPSTLKPSTATPSTATPSTATRRKAISLGHRELDMKWICASMRCDASFVKEGMLLNAGLDEQCCAFQFCACSTGGMDTMSGLRMQHGDSENENAHHSGAEHNGA